jgi:Holliday junction resolvase
MSKFAKRVDANQEQLTKELRELGFSVYHTHALGKGFPDLIINGGMMNHLIELKASGKDKLTDAEKEFIKSFHVIVGHNIEIILKEILIYEYFLFRCLRGKYDNQAKQEKRRNKVNQKTN